MTLPIRLRKPRQNDIAQRLALGQDPDIVRMFGSDAQTLPPLKPAEVMRWLAGLAAQPRASIVEYIAYNTRAIRCYLACGFVIEGHERNAALVSGQRHDDLIMEILTAELRDNRG